MKKIILSTTLLMSVAIAFANCISTKHLLSAESNITTYNFPSTSWDSVADISWYNTTDTSFNLSTAEQLAGLAQLVQNGNNFAGKTINLTANIDLGSHLWISIGYNINKPFSGTFNGQNYSITSLKINRVNDEFLGLFGQVFGGTIENVKVVNPVIRGKGTTGAIVGNLSTNSTLTNCHAVNVDIEVFQSQSLGSGYSTGSVVGGALTNSTITKCSGSGVVKGFAQIGGFIGTPWNSCTIEECSFNGTVEGTGSIGGFVGHTMFAMLPNSQVKIKNCYAIANVSGENHIGGFQGLNQMGDIDNCYAVGTVSATQNKGSFVGGANSSTVITNSYYNQTTSNIAPVGELFGPAPVITAKTTTEIKSNDFLELLNNISNVWHLNENQNDGYPSFSHTLSAKKVNKIVLNIFPNPVTDILTVESKETIKTYEIFDLSGKSISKGILENNIINMQNLNAGTYFIIFETDFGFDNFKVIKK